jgi:ubiquinol-cytochrome c reductase cytochrome c1 subunit
MKIIIVLAFLASLPLAAWAVDEDKSCGDVECDAVKIDLNDKPSLQRGARTFVNFCLSCHNASYMRYNRMGQDLGISEALVEENLLFAADKVGDSMKVVMRNQDAANWFGTAAPDLTLVARWRSPTWVYTYLRGFYRDDKSPSGWNNIVFRNVAMPHVLYEWQGEQRTVVENGEFVRFALDKPGSKTPKQFDRDMRDLTNFLVYLGEPAKLVRYRIGIYVLIFLAVFSIVAYLLKKEYWKDVH